MLRFVSHLIVFAAVAWAGLVFPAGVTPGALRIQAADNTTFSNQFLVSDVTRDGNAVLHPTKYPPPTERYGIFFAKLMQTDGFEQSFGAVDIHEIEGVKAVTVNQNDTIQAVFGRDKNLLTAWRTNQFYMCENSEYDWILAFYKSSTPSAECVPVNVRFENGLLGLGIMGIL